MIKDIISRIKFVVSIVWQTATSTVTGTAVDSKGFDSVGFVVRTGTDTDGTHALTIEESDASGSGFTAVPAARLYGDTIPADLVASKTYRIGVQKRKRYHRAVITVAGSPGTGMQYEAHCILGDPHEIPVTFENA